MLRMMISVVFVSSMHIGAVASVLRTVRVGTVSATVLVAVWTLRMSIRGVWRRNGRRWRRLSRSSSTAC